MLTDSASVHDAAWKKMFDEFLRARAQHDGAAFVLRDAVRDYESYVDGKPRIAGARDFLAVRGIALPEGTHADEPRTRPSRTSDAPDAGSGIPPTTKPESCCAAQ